MWPNRVFLFALQHVAIHALASHISKSLGVIEPVAFWAPSFRSMFIGISSNRWGVCPIMLDAPRIHDLLRFLVFIGTSAGPDPWSPGPFVSITLTPSTGTAAASAGRTSALCFSFPSPKPIENVFFAPRFVRRRRHLQYLRLDHFDAFHGSCSHPCWRNFRPLLFFSCA